jgi:hypothetical protein
MRTLDPRPLQIWGRGCHERERRTRIHGVLDGDETVTARARRNHSDCDHPETQGGDGINRRRACSTQFVCEFF